jgi:hypothetical protein
MLKRPAWLKAATRKRGVTIAALIAAQVVVFLVTVPGVAGPAFAGSEPKTDRERNKTKTNNLGKDGFTIEGNVVRVRCFCDIPQVIIGTKDGEVALNILTKKDNFTCPEATVGDYIYVHEGMKESEVLYEAYEVHHKQQERDNDTRKAERNSKNDQDRTRADGDRDDEEYHENPGINGSQRFDTAIDDTNNYNADHDADNEEKYPAKALPIPPKQDFLTVGKVFQPGEPVSLNVLDGRVTVSAPGGTLWLPFTLAIRPVMTETIAHLPGKRVDNLVFEVGTDNCENKQISNDFPGPVNLAVKVSGGDLSKMTLARFDFGAGRWVAITSQVDAAKNLVSATIQSTNVYAVIER